MILTELWLTKRKNRILLALAINAAIFLLYMLIYYPVYEVNDDSGLTCIVSGVKGARDPHLIYINYYAGLFLAHLYGLAPAVPWTAIVQYLLLFCSFVTVTSVLLRILKSAWFLPLICGFLAVFEYEGYVLLQYTKTAGIIAAAGLALVFSELFAKKESPVFLLIGLILCWIASMYRFQQFEAEIGIFSIAVLYFLLSLSRIREEYDIRLTRKVVTALVMAGLILGGSFGLLALDRSHYTSDEWAEYTRYNEARTQVTDFGIPDFDEHEQEYRELGIDKPAYRLMSNWNFEDPDKFTTETFETIVSWRDPVRPDGSFIRSFLKELVDGLRHMEVFWAFLLILFGWLICGRYGIREILTLVYTGGLGLLLYGYLFYADRFMVHRVDVGIWFAFSLVVLFLYDPRARRRGAIAGVILLMLAALCTVTLWSDQWRSQSADHREAMASERAFIEQLHSDTDHLYLAKTGQLSFFRAYGVFEQVPFGTGDNIHSLGGWTARTLPYQAVLDSYGVRNPFKDMIDNDSVYLVDDDIDLTLDYLRSWYDESAQAEVVKEVGSHTVYRIVSAP